MSSDDRNGNAHKDGRGLFQRVLKLVSGSKQGDKPHAGEHLSTEEKTQMLIRKQRNDLARRREFEELRQLRRQQEAGNSQQSILSGDTHKPSTRQAETLNKINELESQMASRWKQLQDENTVVSSPPDAAPSRSHPFKESRTQPVPTASLPTKAAVAQQPREAVKTPVRAVTIETQTVMAPDSIEMDAAADDQELMELSDPALEEVAVLFASNENEQVEQNLRGMLVKNSPQRGRREVWLTLMDFYRAVGNQPAFETVAMEYTALFSESAPQWFVFDPAFIKKQQLGKANNGPSIYWQSPVKLDSAAGQDFQSKLLAGDDKVVRVMDWNALKEVSVDGGKLVLEALEKLDRPGISLQVTGLTVLMNLLAAQTKANGAQADQVIWKLRLELLRLFDTAEEFDMEAMEYCLAHEISPPSWVKPSCNCENLDNDPDSDDTDDGEETVSTRSSTLLDGMSTGFYGQHTVAPLRLRGALRGSLSKELKEFDEKIPTEGGFLRIACDRLVRIDFSAAGDLLNWVNEKSGQGYSVQLAKVHRLVALFFVVMGISISARISLRKD